MKLLGKEIKFNNNKVYHAGDKPTASEIGAAASSHTHNYAGSSGSGGAANTAIKLNTVRTINGTNFDGTANITTANWGTTRTLTIGNVSKSVNGSGNVSWSLSEIGAAASNHTHSNLLVQNVTDWNTAMSSGFWQGEAKPNAPEPSGWFWGIRTQHSTSKFGGQIAIRNGGARMYFRSQDTNGVGPWYNVYHTGYKPTAADIGAAVSNHNHDSAYLKTSALNDGSSAKTIIWSSDYISNNFSRYNHNHDSVYMKQTDMSLTSIKKTLAITTTWKDTGITGSNLQPGSYIVQVSGIETGPSNMYSEVFTGYMTWHSNTTNSNDSDEIILHKAGHSSNAKSIFLRTIRSLNGYLKLQICATENFTGNTGITFKFRKII